ncbi:hypothetical protein Tco_0341696 [Tanacetum coccineum]
MRGLKMVRIVAFAVMFHSSFEDPKTVCDRKSKILFVQNPKMCTIRKRRKKGFTELTKNMLNGVKHKWTKKPDSSLQRKKNVFWATSEEPEHFGDDELPRPPGLQYDLLKVNVRVLTRPLAPVQTGPRARIHWREQYELDRKAKMTVLERESEDRRRLIQSQRIAEDMRVLQIDTRGMDAADAAIINAQKARIRAAYPPPPN